MWRSRERKTEAEVDCRIEEEGTVVQNRVVWRELVRFVHRPHIEVGKCAVEKEDPAQLNGFKTSGMVSCVLGW